MTQLSRQCAALTVEDHADCVGMMVEDEMCSCACHVPWLWRARLDHHLACRVVRVGDYKGRLLMTDMNDGTVVLDEEVHLAYGAAYGPDITDVTRWEMECLVAADRRKAQE